MTERIQSTELTFLIPDDGAIRNCGTVSFANGFPITGYGSDRKGGPVRLFVGAWTIGLGWNGT